METTRGFNVARHPAARQRRARPVSLIIRRYAKRRAVAEEDFLLHDTDTEQTPVAVDT